MGTLGQRDFMLASLHKLPRAATAYDNEILEFVRREALFGKGIGYVDASLLAAVSLTKEAALWTRDKRLLAVAERLNLAWSEPKAS